jgi:hypothetical protein
MTHVLCPVCRKNTISRDDLRVMQVATSKDGKPVYEITACCSDHDTHSEFKPTKDDLDHYWYCAEQGQCY